MNANSRQENRESHEGNHYEEFLRIEKEPLGFQAQTKLYTTIQTSEYSHSQNQAFIP